MTVIRGRRRIAALLGALTLCLLPLSFLAPGATAQDSGGAIEIRGFATGQVSHISALETGGTRVLNTDVSWSGAAVDADENGLAGAKMNEFARIFQPDRPGKITYARGSGFEVGAGTTNADPNDIQLTALAEA